MKHMPAIAAAAIGVVPSLESELGLEGLVDKAKSAIATLKAKFTPTDDEKLKAETKAKLEVLHQQRKILEKTKSAVSAARDDGTHEIKTKRITHSNFTASTAAEVVAGMARNRKLMAAAHTRLKNAKTKVEIQSIHDGLEAEFAKKGKVAATISVTRAEALRVLDEALACNEVATKYCELVGTLSETKTTSNEGIGSAIAVGLGFFVMFVVVVVAMVIGFIVTMNLFSLCIVSPFIGIPLMVFWIAFLVFIGGDGDPDTVAGHLFAESH